MFILSRTREAYDSPSDAGPAVVTGLGRPGIVVDALVVRCLLMLAMVALFGRAN